MRNSGPFKKLAGRRIKRNREEREEEWEKKRGKSAMDERNDRSANARRLS
jgi:hypothetical protein